MTYRRVCLRMLFALAVVLGVGLGSQSLLSSALFWPGAIVQAAAAPPPVPCPVCNDNNDDTFDSCVNGQCVFTPIDSIPATVVFTLNDSGRGSLRAAIAAANAGDTITFAANVTGTIDLSGGQLEINKNLTIVGPGANVLTLRNTKAPSTTSRVLYVASGTVNISGLTFTGGQPNGAGFGCSIATCGGGINNHGTLTLTQCVVSGNVASGSDGFGGGIFSFGTLTLSGSTVANNSSSGSFSYGGGIYNETGTVTISNSTISGNTASGWYRGYGGGIFGFGDAVAINSTIFGNTTTGALSIGGGIFETVTAKNTIIAGNTANIGPDVSSTFISQGYNLLGNNKDTTITPTTGDQIGTSASPLNPQLAPLANNGGPTQTHALLTNSPALDAGDNCVLTNICATPNPGFALTTDQRGTGFPRLVGDRVDIGAFEFVPPNTPPTLSYASNPSTTYGTALTITPTDGPSDNGSVASVQLISPPVPGITINSSGVISVAATVPAGSYPIQVQATDNEGGANGTTTVNLTLTVNPAPLTVTVNNAWRNLNEANPPFSGTMTGLQNGDAITASYSTMALQTSPAGPYPITATLSDPNNRLRNYDLTNTVGTLTILASCSVALSPTTLPNGTRNVAYQQALNVIALNSTVAGAYNFSHVAGMMPPGMQLVNTSGAWSLRGTPTAGGTYTFTLLAQKAVGTCARARTYTMTIAP